MSHHKIFNLALATILTSAIPCFTVNKMVIAQSTNHIFTETNLQITTPVAQLSNEEIDLLVEQCVEFVNFLAGTKIDSGEKESIFISSSMLRQGKDKEQHIFFLQTIGTVMSNIRERQNDSSTLVSMREEMFSELYFNFYGPRENTTADSLVPSNMLFIGQMLLTVKRYNPVIVADNKSRLLVTKRDLDAITATHNFLASKAGKSPISRNNLSETTISQNFPRLSPNKQKSLANAETNYYLLTSRWSKLSVQQQQTLLNQTFASTNSSPQQQPSARSNSNQSSPQTTSTTQRRIQLSPETQRKLNETVSNMERANGINQRQTTIEPIYNPTFDVPSF